MAETTRARRMVRGAVCRGSRVSSESSPALSNPTMTYAAIKDETRNAPT